MTVALLASACASTGSAPGSAPNDIEVTRHVDYGAPEAPKLSASRCAGGECLCRTKGDDREVDPPAEGQKRFEIRLESTAGSVTLSSPTLGRFSQDAPHKKCFYIDIPAGSSHQMVLEAREPGKGAGLDTKVRIAEYGPRGPYWYDIFAISCGLDESRCTRPRAAEWGQSWLAHRKRGRLDPCGSAVITGLKWDTSGGLHERDGGFLRDLRVEFGLQVKTFETQFAPGATECVPK
jgi:hypothetical protein